jgi:predicted hydrocarbon binding protein
MKGIINKGIQELVEEKFGTDAWDKVKEVAKCEEPFFSAGEDYPDQLTVDLASAASEVSGLPLDTVLVEFGKYWVLNTAPQSYPSIFKLSGNSVREFLANMSRVHQQVTRSVANARPPHLEIEEMPDGRLLVHYESERSLCPVLRGCILGVGVRFNEALDVKEIACSNDGVERCSVEVTFNDS